VSDLRQDPTTREWVIIAKERAKRPHDFACQQTKSEPPDFSPSCPFCPGNEAMTPPETLAYRDHETQNWRARAFANRFPALAPKRRIMKRAQAGFFFGMNGIGVHEVIVETPQHNKPLALMADSEVADVLLAYQERYNVLIRMRFVKSISVFKNHGPLAGMSLEHPHSQLVATPVVPRHIAMRHKVAISYYKNTGKCLYSDLADHELRVGERVVMETERFVVFHPFASHRPFETWIMPRMHQPCFSNASAEDLGNLAHVLRITLLKLHRALNNPDFNYVIDTAPLGNGEKDYYLWYMRIMPRLSATEVAGFEIESGIYINPAVPEQTARLMRELKVG